MPWVQDCGAIWLVAFLHLSVPRAAPDCAGKNLQHPWGADRSQPSRPGAEMRPQLFLLCVRNLWGWGSGRVVHPQDIAPKGQKRINTENSSISSQCQPKPWEIALSMGLFRMKFYSKILAGFNCPFSLHWRFCSSFKYQSREYLFSTNYRANAGSSLPTTSEEDHNPSSCKCSLGGFAPSPAPIRQTQLH